MKVYLASLGKTLSQLTSRSPSKVRELVSYFEVKKKGIEPHERRSDLFLDSGAYSAFTRGVMIDLDVYIAFVHEHKALLTTYANLDVIGDPTKTWENQQEMERQGLKPLPCFHYGEDRVWLKRYMAKHESLAFGGMVPVPGPLQTRWLDENFKAISGRDGASSLKIHGFGLTGRGFLLFRYPWHSVDSTAWRVGSQYGEVVFVFPSKRTTDQIHFGKDCAEKRLVGKHFFTFSPQEQAKLAAIIIAKGFTVEELVESGSARDEWNIRSFCELETSVMGERGKKEQRPGSFF